MVLQKQQGITSPIAILIGSVIIAVAILVAGNVIQIGSKGSTAAPTAAPTANQPQQPVVTLNLIKDTFSKALIKFGNSNAKLIVLEIADPSCPYCQIAAGKNSALNKQAGPQFTAVADGGTYVAPVPEIEKLVNSGQASFAYIFSPGHGNGEMGTKALYCAFDQNKFWQVSDLLMSAAGYDLMNNTIKNDSSKSGDLAKFLSSAADQTALKTCLDSGKYDGRLKTDQALAQGLGITGTPAFYLNANPFLGAYNYKEMESVVTSALK